MLLARRGYRVLLLDRARFPSDSMRAHYLHRPGVALLRRWGLLDRVVASGCPPVRIRTTDFGDGPLAECPPPLDGADADYAPRRFVLDALLVAAAAAAGAEVRQSFAVEGLLTDGGRVAGVRGRGAGGGGGGGAGGGAPVAERARLVVGADGLHSAVARAVGAPVYAAHPARSFAYYSYWSGVPLDGMEVNFRFRPDLLALAFPTNDGLTGVAVQAPVGEFRRFRADVEGSFFRALDQVPALAARVRAGRREERWRGTVDLPSFFRRPAGKGWALVGDAGYHQDPITGLGITNAFRDAALLAEAADEGLAGRRPLDAALAAYHRRRDEAATPGYEAACARAAFAPFPPQTLAARAALRVQEPAPASPAPAPGPLAGSRPEARAA
jgi:2-polyprenyl-6-methoxyphenol hydroxylase-like FAD-dependent oxidoreductase